MIHTHQRLKNVIQGHVYKRQFFCVFCCCSRYASFNIRKKQQNAKKVTFNFIWIQFDQPTDDQYGAIKLQRTLIFYLIQTKKQR